jgi:glutaconyl-CoA/methylmalonyl-CoA decarboxylase subunit gamma
MKYNVKIEDQSYEVEIQDLRARPIVAIVNGTPIEVMPEETLQLLARKTAPDVPAPAHATTAIPAGVPTAVSVNVNAVRAPIPGTIVAVQVQPGDEVIVGQELCTLEAMKMRNAIRSPRVGKISSVHISAGQTVSYGDLLIEYE